MAVNHTIRNSEGGFKEVKNLTARRAIIFHCSECMGWTPGEVRKCTCKFCALYPFRTFDPPQNTM